MKTYIGVDLGGTNVRAAIVNEEGKVLEVSKCASHGQADAETIMNTIEGLIGKLEGRKEAEAIGICVPGPIARDGGSMTMATNIPAIKDYPIRDVLEKATGMKVVLGNDADAAGLAEARVGAGKGLRSVVYITISTGIGGAFVFDGRLIPGAHGCSMEVGSMSVDCSRPHINLPASGAIEDWASGTSVTRRGNEAAGEGTYKHAGMVFDAAIAGDAKAEEVRQGVENDLAVLCANIAVTIDPDIIIFGGGMMKSADAFWDGMIAKYRERALPAVRNLIFKKAELDEPGVVGAAMLPLSVE